MGSLGAATLALGHLGARQERIIGKALFIRLKQLNLLSIKFILYFFSKQIDVLFVF